MLPGMMPTVTAKPGSPGLALSYLTKSVQSGGNTITVPATAQVGDIAIVSIFVPNVTGRLTPGGWTLLCGDANGGLIAKVLSSGDVGATLTLSTTGHSNNRGLCSVFRGASPATSFSVVDAFLYEATTGNPAAQAITPDPGTDTIVVASYVADGVVDPRAATPALPGEQQGSDTRCYMKYATFSPSNSPPSYSVDMDDEGINILASGWLSVV